MLFRRGRSGAVRIEWPEHLDPGSVVAWRYPSTSIHHGALLVVGESQRALFLRDGKLLGVVPAGRHRLDTRELPFLRGLLERVAGGSPFHSSVVLVNLLQYDALFGGRAFIDWVGVHLQFNGSYYFTVDENRLETFYTRLMGAGEEVTVEAVRGKVNPFIVSSLADAFAEYAGEQARAGRTVQSVSDFLAMLGEFSDYARARVAERVDQMYGVRIVDMAFTIDVSDEDKRILQMSGPRAQAAAYERAWRGRETVSSNLGQAGSIAPVLVAPWTMPPPQQQWGPQPPPQQPTPPATGQQAQPPQGVVGGQQPVGPSQPRRSGRPRCPYCGMEVPVFSPVCPYCARPIQWCPDGSPAQPDGGCGQQR